MHPGYAAKWTPLPVATSAPGTGRSSTTFCSWEWFERKTTTEETYGTSIGCKMSKRKTNHWPGRGPAIAERYNLELGIRGSLAAKHMPWAVPMAVYLFFYRSQLKKKKAAKFLQQTSKLWTRACKAKRFLHLHKGCTPNSYEKLLQWNLNLLMY